MQLTSPKNIKNLLLKYETRPSKGLGQNFLIDENVLTKIIESASIKKSDTILEIGPGIGTLTQELAKRAKQVTAVEKDKVMLEILKETLKGYKNIEVIQGDILKLNHPVIRPGAPSNDGANYKVVANIPYYITAPLIRFLLENKNKPEFIVLMVQKEVAQRICSKSPDMTLLSTSVQFYAEPKIVSYVSKNCFLPAPKVDSAIIKITPNQNSGGQVSADLFFKVVKAGFSQPRKQLVNNLTTLNSLNGVKLTKDKISEWLLKNNLTSNQRAETLSILDWTNLAKTFKY